MLATFLADTLRAAGLNVIEHEGWQTNGRGPLVAIEGVICHHTAGPPAPKGGPTPSLNLVLNGRPDLAGPLSQLYLARDGTFHVLAAGRCNHAGAGQWRHIHGNSSSLGIEAENAGDGHDPWPAVQMDAYARGVAAILKHLSLTADDCCGHKEFATPPGRKIDPSFDMAEFRAQVAQFMGDPTTGNFPVVAPAISPRTVKLGSTGPAVVRLQQLLARDGRSPSLTVDGSFGPATLAAVKALQSMEGLTPDGIVGPKTWAAL
ncbi:MAG: N-acetylmuramoyl-L-alanine amidase [Pseudomonadota bacterium]